MDKKELLHWGIKGQKWGKRRFQNQDGSLTPAGEKRYGVGDGDNSTGDFMGPNAKTVPGRKPLGNVGKVKNTSTGDSPKTEKTSTGDFMGPDSKNVPGRKPLFSPKLKKNIDSASEETKNTTKSEDADGFLGPDAKTIPGRKPLGNVGKVKTTIAEDKGDFSPESFKAAKEKREQEEKAKSKGPEDKGDFSPESFKAAEKKRKQEEKEKAKAAKEREKEAEKNKKAEEKEKKENEKEREEAARKKEKEEAEKERNADKREKEAEKNKKAEEKEKKENEKEREEAAKEREKEETAKKKPEDMSTEELKEANKRAEALKKYKENNPTDAELAEKAQKEQLEKDSRKLGLAGTVTTTAGNVIKNQGVEIARQARKMKNAKELGDYESMSTKELREATDRMIAENNYVNAKMAKTTAAQQKLEARISIFGSVLSVAGAGLTLAAAWKKYQAGD